MEKTSSNPFFIQRKKCPICTSKGFITVMEVPYQEKELSRYLSCFYGAQGSIELDYLRNVKFSLCKCQDCRGIFQEFIPNDFLMQKLYEEWISPEKALAAHQEKERNSSLIIEYKSEIKTIKEAFFQTTKNARVLDFGMGWGTWARTAKDLGWEVFGTELSTSRIRYSQKQGIAVINPENLCSQKFDLINTEQVFEHLPEPLTTLKNLEKSLNKNGIIKVSVPTANNIHKRLKIMDWKAPKTSKTSLNPIAPLEHINYFKKESIVKMAQLTGLEEVKIPLMVQYKNIHWNLDLKKSVKKVIRPLRLNLMNDLNYVFLKKY